MEKFLRLEKIASSFSKIAAWDLYITKWAAKETKYLGQLKTFADKTVNPDLKAKLTELHKLYSNFVLNMNPEGTVNLNKIPDNITQTADNIIRSIMKDPALDLKTGLKGEEYLLKNLDKLYDLLPEISLDISNTIDEIAAGAEPEPLDYEERKRLNEQILSEAPEGTEEETELKQFIEKEFGKQEYEEGAPGITYMGEGFGVSGPSKAKSEDEKILDRLQRKQKAKAIQEARKKSVENRTDHDNKLLAQYDRMVATMKAAYLALRADPVKWEKYIESKREGSLKAYHKSDVESLEAKKERMREYSRLIDTPLKQKIKEYIKNNPDNDVEITKFIENKIAYALKTKKNEWANEQEKITAKLLVDEEEKKLIKYLKKTNPFILKVIHELHEANPHISKYQK